MAEGVQETKKNLVDAEAESWTILTVASKGFFSH